VTAIVGIRCQDGVVIGSDSSATFGDGGGHKTIEQSTAKKIEIISESVIVAGTGAVGHMQRFAAVTQSLWDQKAFENKSEIEIGKMLSNGGINDFNQTGAMHHLQFAAMVAYPAEENPSLCEFPGGRGIFQPEIKKADDLWFASMGSGQVITDPFLALLRKVYWVDGAPTLQGGIFTAVWTLEHACDVNPGGINAPVKIAVLAREKGKLRARMLDDAELAEHQNMVAEATKHMAAFKDIVEGKGKPSDVPMPKPA
jgi:ATP-dependent protease HslVU (ClpYQ) peptidase subunit